jgi:hypothetical protein
MAAETVYVHAVNKDFRMETEMTQNEKRFEILQAVLHQYGEAADFCPLPETADDADFGDIEQFVMVQQDNYSDCWYVFGQSADELCEGAASDDSDYEPQLIVDLDTGKAYGVQISYSVGGLSQTFAAVQA